MIPSHCYASNILKGKRLIILCALLVLFSFPAWTFAHPQFTTIAIFDVSPETVALELHIPLGELELAWGHDASKNTETLVERLGPQLKEYLLAHIHPLTPEGKPWTVEVVDLTVEGIQQTPTGPFQKLMAHLILRPPSGVSTRRFVLNYDLILHQVVTHTVFVTVRNDWEGGKTGDPAGVGVIKVDEATGKLLPFEVNLEKGSWWRGFRGMVALGKQHIREGTDHLLFLLTLLIPAPLLVKGSGWAGFGGTKYAVSRLLKIVTAFTLGHSITLLVGALGWVRLPQQPVEVLIAFSILVSAVHAIRPIFPGKEMYVAGSFGLVHGLAFATVLSTLQLAAGPMALSILGFNLGIELMQLGIIAITVPWLILLSLRPSYKWLRIVGSVLAGIAATAWITERVTGNPNIVGTLVQSLASRYAKFIVLLLALTSILSYVFQRKRAITQKLLVEMEIE
jgi:hypothetical protein